MNLVRSMAGRYKIRVHRQGPSGLVPLSPYRHQLHRPNGSPWQNSWVESYGPQMRDGSTPSSKLRYLSLTDYIHPDSMRATKHK